MKRRFAALLAFAVLSSIAAPSPAQNLKAGDKVQTLANLHPDMQRHVLYTLNYQLPGLIPVCANVAITKVGSKKLTFEYQGQAFELGYEGFSKKAGVSFQKAAQTYLGRACDRAAMEKLGATDQEGIRVGVPKLGMTRQGVLFAMGRPPIHANPNLDAPAWTYWKNRYIRTIITFDAAGKVQHIQ